MIKRIILLFIVSFLFMSCFGATSINLTFFNNTVGNNLTEIQKDNQKYDSSIINEFNKLKGTNETFVPLFVYLKNGSDAEKLRFDFNITQINKFLHRENSNTFTVKLTEGEFYKLVKDNRIDKIYYDSPFHAHLNESASIINAKTVWNTLNYTGKGVKICIIDTGVDKYHPDLSGKIEGEYCYNADNECPNGDSVDNNASDDNGHGTHIAGIIASQNSLYRGIAYNASIYAVKVLNSAGGGASWDDAGHAIEWCINQGVNIISMSFGTGGPYNKTNNCLDIIDVDINNATSHNILVIASSGNDYFTTGITYPACSANALSVGATTKQDIIADYTNRGENLDLLSPGGMWNQTLQYSEIISTFSQRVKYDDNLCLIAEYYWWWPWWPLSGCRDSDYEVNNYFIRVAGTSQAAPIVAGAAALLLQKNPALTPDEIKNILHDTGVDVYDNETGLTFKRIDVLAAINSLNFTGHCYQESANVSTACGGLSTGTYLLTGSGWVSHGPGLAVDTNWNTYGSADTSGSHGLVYINYSKPINSENSSKWKVKMGSCSTPTFTNLTIPQSCWSYSSSKLMLKMTSDNYATFGNSEAYCYDGTWNLLLNETNDNCLLEEGMNWELSNTNSSTSNSSFWCTQEFTNVSTACGGLSTGTYTNSNYWTDNIASTVYDGNWETGSSVDVGGHASQVYINYTKPINAQVSSLWQVSGSGGMRNLTIPSSCWDYHTTKINFMAESWALDYTYSDRWSCYNGTWSELDIGGPSTWVYEEAMIWNITSS